MIQDGRNGGVSVPDRATAAEPEVSALRDGIANAEIRGQPVLHPWHSIADELLMRRIADLEAEVAKQKETIDWLRR